MFSMAKKKSYFFLASAIKSWPREKIIFFALKFKIATHDLNPECKRNCNFINQLYIKLGVKL